MDEAYQRDYAHKRLCDEARRAVEAVLENDHHLSRRDLAALQEARERLDRMAAQVVSAWN